MASLHQTATLFSIPTAFLLSSYFLNSSHNAAPILISHPTSVSTAIFKPFYYRGLALVAPLSIISSSSFIYLAYTAHLSKSTSTWHRNMYAAGAALSFGILPWTRLVMAQGIERLIAISGHLTSERSGEVDRLLKAWIAQNWVRAGMTFVAGALGLSAAAVVVQ